jgi:hypothetical protein
MTATATAVVIAVLLALLSVPCGTAEVQQQQQQHPRAVRMYAQPPGEPLHPRCANRSKAYALSLANDPQVSSARVDDVQRHSQMSVASVEVSKARDSHTSVNEYKTRAMSSLAPLDVDPPPWRGPLHDNTRAVTGVCIDHDHGTVYKVGNWEYVRLWKCNNDGIRAMMARWPQPSRPIRFTFVRDPLTRFISAYRELEFRSVRALPRYHGHFVSSCATTDTPLCQLAASRAHPHTHMLIHTHTHTHTHTHMLKHTHTHTHAHPPTRCFLFGISHTCSRASLDAFC